MSMQRQNCDLSALTCATFCGCNFEIAVQIAFATLTHEQTIHLRYRFVKVLGVSALPIRNVVSNGGPGGALRLCDCKGTAFIWIMQIFGREKCLFGEKCTICGKKYTPTCDFWAQVGVEDRLVRQTRKVLVLRVVRVVRVEETALAGG